MKMKKTFFFIAGLAAIVGVIAFSSSQKIPAVSGKDKIDKVSYESSVYVEMNQDELFGYADIVASGKIINVSPPKEYKHNIGGEDKSIICKDYVFQVNESYKGSSSGSQIIIRVPGGQKDNNTYISDAETPDLKNEQVLFLKQYQGDNSGDVTYSILGGPQGKYVVDGKNAINIEKEKDLNQFKGELNSLRTKIGNKTILPQGFIK